VPGQNLSAKLREHFYRVRESFRRDLDGHPDPPARRPAAPPRRDDEIAIASGATREAAELLEQAAKEMGGSTDRHGPYKDAPGRTGQLDAAPIHLSVGKA